MPLVEHVSKTVPGWAIGPTDNTELALEAWEEAKGWIKRQGISIKGVIVHHDRDQVYTSYAWAYQVLVKDGAKLSYALRGVRDNPEMESFIGRFKEENKSLFLDAGELKVLKEVVKKQIWHYNHERRHSSIGYQAPMRYLQKHWTVSNKTLTN